jgi:pimeloyl-ACP methyl ester carboxylesterase
MNAWARPLAALVVALSTGTLAGCGVLVTLFASLESNDGSNHAPKQPPPLATDAYVVETAHKFALMALFAEVVYRRDIPKDVRTGQGCDYLKPGNAGSKRALFGMPRGGAEAGRWERWIPTAGPADVRPCEDSSGLYYETYVHVDGDGKLDEAVIAYRGTENRSGQYWYDWSSNFVALLGIEPPQYALAAERLEPLVKALKAQLDRDGKGGKIYVVGHSLGGGLAQQAGYLSKDVAEVVTFNTSPVTNWSYLRLHEKVRNAYPTIHRLYHGGEFLEKVRFVTTSLTEARFGRHDIGLQLQDRSNFGGHDMKIFTCNFAEVLTKQGGPEMAAHHLPLSYLSDEVIRQTPREPDEALICNVPPDA